MQRIKFTSTAIVSIASDARTYSKFLSQAHCIGNRFCLVFSPSPTDNTYKIIKCGKSIFTMQTMAFNRPGIPMQKLALIYLLEIRSSNVIVKQHWLRKYRCHYIIMRKTIDVVVRHSRCVRCSHCMVIFTSMVWRSCSISLYYIDRSIAWASEDHYTIYSRDLLEHLFLSSTTERQNAQ